MSLNTNIKKVRPLVSTGNSDLEFEGNSQLTTSVVSSLLFEWKGEYLRRNEDVASLTAAAEAVRSRLILDGTDFVRRVADHGVSALDVDRELQGYPGRVIPNAGFHELSNMVDNLVSSRCGWYKRISHIKEQDYDHLHGLVSVLTPVLFIIMWIFFFKFDTALGLAFWAFVAAQIGVVGFKFHRKSENARQLDLAKRGAIRDAVNEIRECRSIKATVDALFQKKRKALDEAEQKMRAAHAKNLRDSLGLLDFQSKSAAGSPSYLYIGAIRVDYVNLTMPWASAWLKGESLIFKAGSVAGMNQALDCARNIVWQLLKGFPLGSVRFTFIDPVAVGKNFNMFLPLSNDGHAPLVVNTKAWSDSRDIEMRLDELVSHMENVTQKYLIDFDTLESYNAKAIVREPYHLVVIADAPEHLSSRAFEQLVRIFNQGEKCGVYVLMVFNETAKVQSQFDLKLLERSAYVYTESEGKWKLPTMHMPPDLYEIALAEAPNSQEIQAWIREFGPKFKTAMSVQVTRLDLLKASGLSTERLWTLDSTEGLKIPLGPSGASGVRELVFRTSSASTLPPVNAVLVGRPGSGKSNLMHILITNALQLYGPDELELYLLDFKDGVEFKAYTFGNLPQIKVVGIESERQFGLSVLERVEAVRLERSLLFKSADVSDLPAYRVKTRNKVPRVLVVIDEFQQLFAVEDAISRKCQNLLEVLVRLGRSAGIHTILASQNLVGNLPKSLLDLISVRIALQCSSDDAARVLADNNTAAAQLTRPGEAIYNAAAGSKEGNVFFQVAFSNDEERKSQLGVISREADRRNLRSNTRVFDGARAADLKRCGLLQSLVNGIDRQSLPKNPVLVLGEPMSLTDATIMQLRRQAGNNLLVVCKEEGLAASVVMSVMLSLVGYFGASVAKLRIRALDLSTADQEDEHGRLTAKTLLHAFAEHLSDVYSNIDRRRGLSALLAELDNTIGARSESSRQELRTEIILIFGLHRARDLAEAQSAAYAFGSRDDEPNISKQFARILRDGPEVRVHTLVWCDSYANFKRAADGQLGEFGVRVCGPMSSGDAMTMVDASGELNLKENRLVKYDEEKTGVLDVFRPYDLVSGADLKKTVSSIKERSQRDGN